MGFSKRQFEKLTLKGIPLLLGALLSIAKAPGETDMMAASPEL